jgi:hypothetical protein
MIDVLQRNWLYAHPETQVTFIGNHDTSRSTGEPDSSKEKLFRCYLPCEAFARSTAATRLECEEGTILTAAGISQEDSR